MIKICAAAGCRATTSKRHCTVHAAVVAKKDKEKAKKRAIESSKRYDPKYKKFYSSSAWKALRNKKIKDSPLCEHCMKRDIVKAATDIDHIIEIKDDFSMRLQYSNLQSLCRSCHMLKTRREKLVRSDSK